MKYPDNEIEETKRAIKELIKQLPVSEAGQYEAAIMAFELQEELQLVLKSKAKDIKKKIADIAEKQKALDMLIDINAKFVTLCNNLTAEEKEVMNLRGKGIRDHIKKRNANSIKRSNDSGVHARASEVVQDGHAAGGGD